MRVKTDTEYIYTNTKYIQTQIQNATGQLVPWQPSLNWITIDAKQIYRQTIIFFLKFGFKQSYLCPSRASVNPQWSPYGVPSYPVGGASTGISFICRLVTHTGKGHTGDWQGYGHCFILSYTMTASPRSTLYVQKNYYIIWTGISFHCRLATHWQGYILQTVSYLSTASGSPLCATSRSSSTTGLVLASSAVWYTVHTVDVNH